MNVNTPKGAHSSRKLQYAALQNLTRNSMIPQANTKFSPMNTNNFNDSPDPNKMHYPLNFAELSPFNNKRQDMINSPHLQNQYAYMNDDLEGFTSLKNAWPKAVQSPYIKVHEESSPMYFGKGNGAVNGFDGYMNNFAAKNSQYDASNFSAFKTKSPRPSQFAVNSPRIFNQDQLNSKL